MDAEVSDDQNYLNILGRAGWTTYEPGWAEITNDAGVLTRLSGRSTAKGNFKAILFTGDPANLYKLRFTLDRLDELLAIVDASARNAQPGNEQQWLRELARHDVHVVWQESSSSEVEFART